MKHLFGGGTTSANSKACRQPSFEPPHRHRWPDGGGRPRRARRRRHLQIAFTPLKQTLAGSGEKTLMKLVVARATGRCWASTWWARRPPRSFRASRSRSNVARPKRSSTHDRYPPDAAEELGRCGSRGRPNHELVVIPTRPNHGASCTIAGRRWRRRHLTDAQQGIRARCALKTSHSNAAGRCKLTSDAGPAAEVNRDSGALALGAWHISGFGVRYAQPKDLKRTFHRLAFL